MCNDESGLASELSRGLGFDNVCDLGFLVYICTSDWFGNSEIAISVLEGLLTLVGYRLKKTQPRGFINTGRLSS